MIYLVLVQSQVTESNSVTGTNVIDVRVEHGKTEEEEEHEVLYEVEQQAEGSFHETMLKEGTYEICFDNTDSSWAQKVTIAIDSSFFPSQYDSILCRLFGLR